MIAFPERNQHNAQALLSKADALLSKAQAQAAVYVEQANLIVDATAGALAVPDDWRLDMSSPTWQFVPQEKSSETAQ